MLCMNRLDISFGREFVKTACCKRGSFSRCILRAFGKVSRSFLGLKKHWKCFWKQGARHIRIFERFYLILGIILVPFLVFAWGVWPKTFASEAFFSQDCGLQVSRCLSRLDFWRILVAPCSRFRCILLHEACWLEVSLQASKRPPGSIASWRFLIRFIYCPRFGGCRLCGFQEPGQ